jgi:hypothetical protein
MPPASTFPTPPASAGSGNAPDKAAAAFASSTADMMSGKAADEYNEKFLSDSCEFNINWTLEKGQAAAELQGPCKCQRCRAQFDMAGWQARLSAEASATLRILRYQAHDLLTLLGFDGHKSRLKPLIASKVMQY